jgi:hypothetical protein
VQFLGLPFGSKIVKKEQFPTISIIAETQASAMKETIIKDEKIAARVVYTEGLGVRVSYRARLLRFNDLSGLCWGYVLQKASAVLGNLNEPQIKKLCH